MDKTSGCIVWTPAEAPEQEWMEGQEGVPKQTICYRRTMEDVRMTCFQDFGSPEPQTAGNTLFATFLLSYSHVISRM